MAPISETIKNMNADAISEIRNNKYAGAIREIRQE